MKILYDYQTFKNRFGGIARYHYELSNGIRYLGNNTEIATLLSPNHYLQNDPRYFVLNPIGHNPFRGRYKISQYIEQINKAYSSIRIKSNNFDIFHPTYYDTYFKRLLNKPLVITVHDFVHEKYDPLRTNDINNKRQLIYDSDKIIAISNNTKKDILDYYNIADDKIEVIYHGIHPFKKKYLRNQYGTYLLFVGDRKGYKNFTTFFDAASSILKQHSRLNLVCTGSPFSEEEIHLIKYQNLEKQVFQISANETELNSLYRHALAFFYPSFYEGFGMPILEAFSNHCPVCLSNASCFPEIASEAAIYFDPSSVDSIRLTIEKIISDKIIRIRLIELGLKRMKDFSWDSTCKKTNALYKSIL